MPRHCKIRKRVSSSSSTSTTTTTTSTLAKNYSFKRVNHSTSMANSNSNSRSPMQKMESFENVVKYGKNGISGNYDNNHCHYGNSKKKEALSARKLAANMWEIEGMNSPKDDLFEERIKGRKSNESSDNFVGKLFDGQKYLLLDQFPHHSPVCEKTDGSKGGSHRRRSTSTSHKVEITEYMSGGLEAVCKSSPIEVSNFASRENNLNTKARLKDVNNSLIASKELVKVLYRLMSQEEQQSSRLTLVSALRVELDRARLQVDQLIHGQRYNSEQMDALLRQFSEEKAAWKSKEKQKIKEVETERKLRRQAERLNKKLGLELAETRTHFEKAMNELDGERRAREILEQTCDELARGIGEERVEVEELKKESEKVRKEVEKEREMLQLADVLREERVQMKLQEARYEYEEKNAALERLRNELGIYLENGESKENVETAPYFDGVEDFKDFLKTMQLRSFQDRESAEEESDDESELHSIELNMGNNKCPKWSFGCDGSNQGDSRRASMEEVFKGRRSLSEKIQWENICLQKTASNGIEVDLNGVKENSLEVRPNGESNEGDKEFKRYKSIKSQRLPYYQGSVSPAMSTGKSSGLREACSAILKDLAARREQLEGQCVT